MSPALNESSEIQCLEPSDAIKWGMEPGNEAKGVEPKNEVRGVEPGHTVGSGGWE